MPVDPTISLNVTGGKGGMADPNYTAGTAANPLNTIQSFADTQKKLNEIKLFNQSFKAKQKFGQIMADSPNTDTAIQRAFQDPDVAPFAPEIVQTIAASNNLRQEGLTKEYSRRHDAFTRAAGVIQGGLVDPGSMERNLPAFLNNIPDKADREFVGSNIRDLITGLTHDLPSDPAEAKAEYGRRALAAGFATGSQDALMKQLPQPGTIETADAAGNAVTQPVTVGSAVPNVLSPTAGAITKVGNALSQGLKPGVYSPEGMIAGTKGSARGRASAGGSAPVDKEVASKIGADNRPLIPEGLSMDSPPVDRSSFGQPIGPQAKSIAEMQAKWAGPETEAYQNSGILLGQLAEMKHNLDGLEKGKGLLAPGAGAEFRLGLAKVGKLVEDLTGTDLGVDKAKIANAEDAMKLTQRLGISYLTSVLGSQREAAETIRNITEKGIPGIQNTYLGSALMTDMIESIARRSMEEHEFRTIWQSRPANRGNLTGADIAFNKAHPAIDYVNQALNKYGITESGFKSRAAMDAALAKGLITVEQAEVIRKNGGKIPADLPPAEPAQTK